MHYYSCMHNRPRGKGTAMALYLHGLSALHYWVLARLGAPQNAPLMELLARPLPEATRFARLSSLHATRPSSEDVGRLLRAELCGLRLPLHLLVASESQRRPSLHAVYHVWSSPPDPKAFVRISVDLYVSSPAFCLAQLAGKLDMLDLIVLGYELCGAYLPDEYEMSGLRHCPPLVRPEELVRFSRNLPRTKGKRNLQRAAKYMLYGSASPAETKLAMKLSLPRMLGGYGFPPPSMNHRVSMAKAVQSAWDSTDCLCDLFWPNHRLDVEYDGKASHADMGRDAVRRNRLASAGITVVTVTGEQMKDFNQMDVIAHQVRRHLHVRACATDVPRGWLSRACALHRRLLQADFMVTPRLVSCS